MGSLSIQPPSGAMRNLTEVFVYLRNATKQEQFFAVDFEQKQNSEDTVRLINLNEDKISYNKTPPAWINVIDEINYEFTRIKSRIFSLRELQNKKLRNPSIADDEMTSQQVKIQELTEEITNMFNHARRLIRLLEDSDNISIGALDEIRKNVISNMMLTLTNFINDFRVSQSDYLRHLDSNSKLDSFLVKSDATIFSAPSEIPVIEEEQSILQIQQILENEHVTKVREMEILKISKSILEMNGIFKDIASMIVDQGTILDRIDYNVEHSSTKIKSALESVQKAEKYQRGNKKMHLIVLLAGFAIFLILLIILTKF
uniref:t-SNARE coiled-coil homology domain-containing protein n=1 Tax=Meloidogyne incognita TaxID=6306 RepID=A0A914LLG3_MELIC